MKLEVHIGTASLEESNEFLRSLWAELAYEFGKCAWNYTPIKSGNRIFLGYIDINQNRNMFVQISFKKKGTINSISFKYATNGGGLWDGEDLSKDSDLYRRINFVIKTVKNGTIKKEYMLKGAITSQFPLSSYYGENFYIELLSNGETAFVSRVKAYDINQAQGYMRKKSNELIDFLSVETNALFSIIEPPENEHSVKMLEEIYQEENAYIDGLSLVKKQLVISKEAKAFIDIFTSPDEGAPEVELFLKACGHFHEGRKIEETMYERHNGDIVCVIEKNKIELASTLYLSSLEVVTLIDFKEVKCESCGQSKYKITKRVKEIVRKYLPEDIAKDFVRYYDKRSKYLHTGLGMINETPTEFSVPLLDPDDPTGCRFPIKLPIINLREYVSYCLRHFYKEHFTNSIGKN